MRVKSEVEEGGSSVTVMKEEGPEGEDSESLCVCVNVGLDAVGLQ